MRRSDWLGGLYEETGLFEGPSARWPAWRSRLMAGELVAEALGPIGALTMWGAFARALGDDAVRAAYGPAWPRAVQPGECVYVYREAGAADWLGWGSLRPSVADGVVWLALGVWPAWQGAGWCHRIRTHLLGIAEERWPSMVPIVAILQSNQRHRDRWERWIREGVLPGWVACGHWTAPAPPVVFFAYRPALSVP